MCCFRLQNCSMADGCVTLCSLFGSLNKSIKLIYFKIHFTNPRVAKTTRIHQNGLAAIRPFGQWTSGTVFELLGIKWFLKTSAYFSIFFCIILSFLVGFGLFLFAQFASENAGCHKSCSLIRRLLCSLNAWNIARWRHMDNFVPFDTRGIFGFTNKLRTLCAEDFVIFSCFIKNQTYLLQDRRQSVFVPKQHPKDYYHPLLTSYSLISLQY